MIKCSVQGQELIVGSPVIAADSINYLTAEFIFRTSDWDGLVKIARLSNGKNAVDFFFHCCILHGIPCFRALSSAG